MMKYYFSFVCFLFVGLLAQSQSFTPGNLVILRVGDGSVTATNITAKAFLDEYTTSGVFVRTLEIPSSGVTGNNKAITIPYRVNNNPLSLSADGSFLTVIGYNTAPGTSNAITSTTINRGIALIGHNGVINSSTSIADADFDLSSSITDNGTNFWFSGAAGGIRHTTMGATTSTKINGGTPDVTASSQVAIFNNNLYIHPSANYTLVSQLGNGLPVTSGQIISSLPGMDPGRADSKGFIFLDTDGNNAPDLLYYISQRVGSAFTGITKYSLISGTWVRKGKIPFTSTDRPLAITAGMDGTAIHIYATMGQGTRLTKYTDFSGPDGDLDANPANSVDLVTAGTNRYLTGISFAPVAVVQTTPSISLSLGAAAVKNMGDPDFEIPAAVTNSTGVVSYRTDPAGSTVAEVYRDASDGNKWKIKIKAVGTVNIIADVAATTAYTAASAAPVVLTVNKGTPVIHFNLGSLPLLTFGDAPVEIPAATSNNPAAITYESADPSIAETYLDAADNKWKIRIIGAGNTNITAKQAANTNWNEGHTTQSLTIAKGTQVLTFNTAIADKMYGDAPFSIAPATSTTSNAIYYESSDPSIAEIIWDASASTWRIVIRGAGNVSITARQNGTASYEAAADVSQPLLIRKKALTLTADNKSKLAGDPNPALTFSSNGFIAGEDNTVFTVQPQLTTTADLSSPAGDYQVTFSVPASAANYDITHVNGVLSVGALQTISFPALTNITYGAPAFDPAATSNSNAVPVYSSGNTAVAIIDANNKVQIVGTGTARIIASFPASGSYVPTTAEQSFQVLKKSLLITADEKTKIYGTPNPALTASYNGFVYGEISDVLLTRPAVTTTATNTSPVGTYPVIATGAAAANYDISYQPGVLTVTKAELTATAEDKHKVQGDPNPPFTISYSGFVNGDNISTLTSAPVASSVADQNSPAGEYPITVSGGVSSNYTFVYVSGRLIVQPLQTVTFTAFPSVIYGDATLVLNAASAAGTNPVYTSDNPAVAVVENGNRIRIVSAGTATIRAAFPATSVYAATTVSQLLNVQKKTLTVTADNQTRRYKQPNPVFTYSFSGFVNNETSTVLTTQPLASSAATESSNVGVYPIGVSGAAAANYIFNYVPGALTITQDTRTLQFNPLPSRTYGVPDYDPGARLSSNETVEYSSSNTGVATIVNNKIHIIGTGTATITASAPANSNYTTTPVQSHDLLVNKAAQAISFAAIPVLQKGDAAYALTVTASSGLPVTLTLDDPTLATVTGTQLTPLHAGHTRVTASQPGDANYLPATAVNQQLVIGGGQKEEVMINHALSPNGDGINDVLVIDGISDFPENYVVIFDINGNKVFQLSNYNNASHAFRGTKNNSNQLLPAGTYFCKVEYVAADKIKRSVAGYVVIKYSK